MVAVAEAAVERMVFAGASLLLSLAEEKKTIFGFLEGKKINHFAKWD